MTLSTRPSPSSLQLCFICLSTLDAATKSIGGGLGNRFAGQSGIERITQFAGTHSGLVARVIDSSPINQFVGTVNEVGLRRYCGAETVGDLVSCIFQNRERQFLFSSVRFHGVC